jgi:hypothetical protein
VVRQEADARDAEAMHLDLLARGLGFVEKSADMAPVQLSIDLRAQHAVRDELAWGMATLSRLVTPRMWAAAVPFG